LSKKRARFLASLAGLAQTDFRVSSNRQQLFPPIDPVLEPPELSASRGDQQEHACPVRQLDRLFARLGISNCHICKRHVPPAFPGISPKIPPSVGVSNWPFANTPQSYPQKLVAKCERG